jgi:hypothetical protein
MNDQEILERLLANLKMIQGIRTDDGYVMHRIASIGRGSTDLLNQLDVDDEDDLALIKEAVERLSKIDGIERRYYDDEEYKKWIRKETRAGNINIFMDAIHCVEGALEIFLGKAGWYGRK